MDRLEAMSILLAAVETGSLSAASRRLGIPLTTVSRNVSELEAHLRTRLLNRTSRRLILTEAGRAYAAACRRILEDVDDAERTAAGEFVAPRGELAVTAPIVFGRLHVLPVVIDFLKAYPEIGVRLALTDRLANLHDEDIDVAVRIGELPDSALVTTRVGATRRVTCASPAYFAARGIPQSPGDLAAHDCIAFQGLASPAEWVFAADGALVSVAVRARLVVSTAEAAIDAAVAGIGVTRVFSYQAAAALHAGALTLTLRAFEPPAWPINLVYAGQGRSPMKLRAFLDFAAPRLRARLTDS